MLQSLKTHSVIYASYIWIAIMHAKQSLLSPRTLLGGGGLYALSQWASRSVRPSIWLSRSLLLVSRSLWQIGPVGMMHAIHGADSKVVIIYFYSSMGILYFTLFMCWWS